MGQAYFQFRLPGGEVEPGQIAEPLPVGSPGPEPGPVQVYDEDFTRVIYQEVSCRQVPVLNTGLVHVGDALGQVHYRIGHQPGSGIGNK